MDSLEIPGSYQSYLETFEENPVLAIQRLGNRVEKRNAGAVGYFLLSWLYFRNGDTEKALENAFQAKVRAPGSQLIGRLHYYISKSMISSLPGTLSSERVSAERISTKGT